MKTETINNAKRNSMTTKLYFTFTEFEENYSNDFKEWQTKYTDGLEKDFISGLLDNYFYVFDIDLYLDKREIDYRNIVIKQKETNSEIDIKFINFISILEQRLSVLFKENEVEYQFFIDSVLGENPQIYDGSKFECLADINVINPNFKDKYIIDNKDILKIFFFYQFFLDIKIETYSELHLAKIDYEKIKNFRYSSKKIIDFLWNKYNSLKDIPSYTKTQKPTEVVEPIEEVKTQNEFSHIEIDEDLLKYLAENFTSTNKRFTELTKFNQIYRFLNKGKVYNIEHTSYKQIVNKLFDFNYHRREIKGETEKHQIQLEKIEKNYYESKK